MPVAVFGVQAAVSMLNRAFNDISPTSEIYVNQVLIAGTTPESIRDFAIRFGEGYASMSDSALAHRVLSNMGLLPNAELLLGLAAAGNAAAATAAAAAVLAQAIAQLEAANAVRVKVDAIAAVVVPDQAVTLVGQVAHPVSDY